MKWGTNKDSLLRQPIVEWINLHLSSRFHMQTGVERRDMALLGFRIFGEEPKPLWDVYARWSCPTNKDFDTLDGINLLVGST
jgi:hypothetical protein